MSLRDVLPNDGRHIHATLLLPPGSRLKDVVAQFRELEKTYLDAQYGIAKLDCEPVTYTPGHAHTYVMKAVLNRRLDDLLWFVLPRSSSDMKAG